MVREITAAFANALPEAPGSIVFIPEGESTITPYVNGKPQSVVVKLDASNGASIAEKLNAQLAARHAANVRPWLDFEHKGGKASGIPKAFSYVEGRGITMDVEWTNAGKQAIEGKDFSYFSPTFLIADDGTPQGIPERGALGGLVNEPAFRNIPRIAASDATNHQPTNQTSTMSKLINAKLGLAPEASEEATLAKIEAITAELETIKTEKAALETAKADEVKRLTDERDAITAELETLKTEAKEATKTRHKALVEASGIPPKDEETRNEALSLLEANEALGVKFLAKFGGVDPSKSVLEKQGDKIEASDASPLDRLAAAISE